MSTTDTNMPDGNFSDESLSPEEQAIFDTMRTGGDIENLPPPADDTAKVPPADGTVPAEQTPQPDPNDPDPDVEVIDPKTNTKQRRVSIHKFQRTEERAKALEKQLEDERKAKSEQEQKYARLDERLRILNEALATPEQPVQQPQQEEFPDPEKDIFGAVRYLSNQLKQSNERIEQFENSNRQREADNELSQTYQEDAARFASTQPSFAEAYVYLINQRDRELTIHGVKDKKQREQQIVREERGLVKAALEAGKSPAEQIYEMATGRGYVPKPAAAAAPAAQQERKDPNALDAGGVPQRQQAAPAAPATAAAAQVPSVSAEIEAIKKGQAASMSLSDTGGSSPPRELTPQTLADMDDEEFNDLLARLPKNRVRELMGD